MSNLANVRHALVASVLLGGCGNGAIQSLNTQVQLGTLPPGKTTSTVVRLTNPSNKDTARIIGLDKLCGVRIVGLESSLIPPGGSVTATAEIYVPKVPGEHMAQINLEYLIGKQSVPYTRTIYMTVPAEVALSQDEVELVKGKGEVTLTGLTKTAVVSVEPHISEGLEANVRGKSIQFEASMVGETTWKRKVTVSGPDKSDTCFELTICQCPAADEPRLYPRKLYAVPNQPLSSMIVSNAPVAGVKALSKGITLKVSGRRLSLTCDQAANRPVLITGIVNGKEVVLGEVYCGD